MELPMSDSVLAAVTNVEIWLGMACLVLTALLLRQRMRGAQCDQALRQESRMLAGRLSDMAQRTNDIVLLLAGDGRILDANDRAVEAYGYLHDELLTMNVRTLRAPEARLAVDTDMAEAARTGSARLETLHVRKDGTTFPVEISARIVADDGPLIFQDVIRDISDRKRSEAALRDSEARLRAIMSGARDGIVMIDNAGRVTFWNQAAEEVFGYTSAEMHGKDLHEVVTPEAFRPAHQSAFAAWRHTGEGAAIGRTLELPARCKDGSERIIELSLASVPGEDGWNAVAIVRDVSARKLAELELRRAKESAEITRNELLLTNARLETLTRTAQEMAEQARTASAAKGEFLARMSHEIRTPMNAIIGMTGLLLDTPLNDEQRDFADTVRRSADALLGIINDVLDYSKIEAGRIDLEQIGFDIRETIEDAVEVCAIAAEQKQLGLSCLIADEVPARAVGDPGRLRQVLLNLLGNALKFTERGSVSVRVAVDRSDERSMTLRIGVRDTGIGIPAAKVSQLFDSFTQADSSITRRYGGTGLGLAITKRLVELMGGHVEIESVEAKGTTITFTVRVGACAEGEELAVLPEELAGTRVLVVDDSASNRFVLTEQLRSVHCRYDAAGDAASAIAKLHVALAAFDRDSLLRRMDGDVGLMQEMIGLFISDTPGRLLDVTEAVRAQRLDELADLAHMLKGTGRTIGAVAFGETAAQMETACREGNLIEARALAATLSRDYTEVQPLLAAEIGAAA